MNSGFLINEDFHCPGLPLSEDPWYFNIFILQVDLENLNIYVYIIFYKYIYIYSGFSVNKKKAVIGTVCYWEVIC